MALTVVTANVNGIRAALRRGGLAWLGSSGAEVLCLQEVRATAGQARAALDEAGLGGWELALAEGPRAGHGGVALLARGGLSDVRIGPGAPEFVGEGRWIDAVVAQPSGRPGIRLASTYVHTGEHEGPKRAQKDRFLAAMGEWMGRHGGGAALVCGDLNVAHTSADIKNWRGNRGKAGFLESERAHLDRWYAPAPDGLGWVDLGRRFGGEGPGPYTWWSWRGRGFDTDGGWRIDVALASPGLAARAMGVVVHKAATYAERWSDHAAVSVTLD
jgi:exodeoxyribonuclease-3